MAVHVKCLAARPVLTECCVRARSMGAAAVQVTIAFINAKRSKECGSCGSLLDAICLQKV